MYKSHKAIIIIFFILISIICYIFRFDYADISSEAINIIAIASAVYLAAFAGLQSNTELTKRLKETDDILRQKSKLGIFNTYVKVALVIGILTIVASCGFQLIHAKLAFNTPQGQVFSNIYYMFSAVGLGLLSTNFLLMWLVGKFILNRIAYAK